MQNQKLMQRKWKEWKRRRRKKWKMKSVPKHNESQYPDEVCKSNILEYSKHLREYEQC